jgi:hypothetical protein
MSDQFYDILVAKEYEAKQGEGYEKRTAWNRVGRAWTSKSGSSLSFDLPVHFLKYDWASTLLLPTWGLITFARVYGCSSQAAKRGVSLESSGLRFSSNRSVRTTPHSLKFTDGPGSCRLSIGRVPIALFHDPL